MPDVLEKIVPDVTAHKIMPRFTLSLLVPLTSALLNSSDKSNEVFLSHKIKPLYME